MSVISFAKRQVGHQTIDKIISLNSEIKVGSKMAEQTLDDLLVGLGKNLKLDGSLGLVPIANTRDALVLEELEKNGIKLWLASASPA